MSEVDGLNCSGGTNEKHTTFRLSSLDRSITKWFLLGLAAYFAAHTLLRVLVSSSLELDEAEQALFSQWVRGSYLSKPPLYTWLQIVFFRVFGTGVFALSVLKNSLLFSTYAFVFFGGRLLFRDAKPALVAALSLLFIPQISWESQRDLTHSILVTSLSAMSFHAVLCLLEANAARCYLWFGLLAGLGMLAKYNYAVFAAALLLTLLTFPRGRAVLFNRRILLSAAIALAVTLPYVLWLASHLGVATSSADKFNMLTHGFIVRGSLRLLSVIVLFLAPLCMVYLVVFARGFMAAARNRPARAVPFPLRRYFLILLGLLWAMVLLWGVTYFKDRWMQPLFFLFPLYFLTYVSDDALTGKRMRRFIAVAVLTAGIVLIAIPARIVLGPQLDYYTAFNFPYAAVAESISRYCPDADLIVADRPLHAGNIRLQLPDSLVLAPTLEPIQAGKVAADHNTVVFWDARESAQIPARLKTYLMSELEINPDELTVSYQEFRYEYSKDRSARVAFGCVK